MPTNPYKVERILVPLDGSEIAEQAIPYIAEVAAENAQITFIQVILEVHPERNLIGHVTVPKTEVEHRARVHAIEYLEATATRWRAVLPDAPRFEVAVGDPVHEIIEAAKRLSCELIAVAGHGRSGIKRLAIGSVAESLAHKSPVPLLLVRIREADEQRAAKVDRIVVPYDGSELSRAAIPVAIDFARGTGIELTLVQVVNPVAYMPPASPMDPSFSPEVYVDVMDEVETEAVEGIKQATAEIAEYGVTAKFELLKGSPAQVLIEQTRPDDLIVMTSHGRSGLKRLILGSVAGRLVREGHAPVVLVPAPGRQH
jgi:nucleotide-binding universal stress UspA family protein